MFGVVVGWVGAISVEKSENFRIFNNSSLFTRFHQDSVIFNKKHRYAPFDIGSSCSIDLGMCERRPCARVPLSCCLQPGNAFFIVIKTIHVPVLCNSESTQVVPVTSRDSCEKAQ